MHFTAVKVCLTGVETAIQSRWLAKTVGHWGYIQHDVFDSSRFLSNCLHHSVWSYLHVYPRSIGFCIYYNGRITWHIKRGVCWFVWNQQDNGSIFDSINPCNQYLHSGNSSADEVSWTVSDMETRRLTASFLRNALCEYCDYRIIEQQEKISYKLNKKQYSCLKCAIERNFISDQEIIKFLKSKIPEKRIPHWKIEQQRVRYWI